ncbi:uncharacterized protein BXZ73DRAFT_78054 [Epithele typhae]|uniref:uncharacterized protein n=1 Tax=Epithele typhae TaxID=378194 RepID=UPI002008E6D3|nr:uncharacterized protein BXZ73DRAFT_78054 [Epithele typhae]KAH9929949.1 hypothetical protein BXZ73DRAFT_78054 [Epithele typhae]
MATWAVRAEGSVHIVLPAVGLGMRHWRRWGEDGSCGGHRGQRQGDDEDAAGSAKRGSAHDKASPVSASVLALSSQSSQSSQSSPSFCPGATSSRSTRTRPSPAMASCLVRLCSAAVVAVSYIAHLPTTNSGFCVVDAPTCNPSQAMARLGVRIAPRGSSHWRLLQLLLRPRKHRQLLAVLDTWRVLRRWHDLLVAPGPLACLVWQHLEARQRLHDGLPVALPLHWREDLRAHTRYHQHEATVVAERGICEPLCVLHPDCVVREEHWCARCGGKNRGEELGNGECVVDDVCRGTGGTWHATLACVVLTSPTLSASLTLMNSE